MNCPKLKPLYGSYAVTTEIRPSSSGEVSSILSNLGGKEWRAYCSASLLANSFFASRVSLAKLIQSILSRKAQAGKSSVSQSVYNLKDAAKMLSFLTANNIMDMAGLDEKFSSMLDEQMDIRNKLKLIERRLPVLKKHMEQADIYFKHRGKKTLREADQILFTAATTYLKGVMNGHTALPVKAWKSEYTKLTAEHRTLNQRYISLKDEVKEAEQIRKSVYSILRR